MIFLPSFLKVFKFESTDLKLSIKAKNRGIVLIGEGLKNTFSPLLIFSYALKSVMYCELKVKRLCAGLTCTRTVHLLLLDYVF